MFSLKHGYFQSVPCPYKACGRNPCLFSHEPGLTTDIDLGFPPLVSSGSSSSSKRRKAVEDENEDETDSTNRITKRPAIANPGVAKSMSREINLKGSSTSGSSTQYHSQAPRSKQIQDDLKDKAAAALVSPSSSKQPCPKLNLLPSQTLIPLKNRQQYLEALYKGFQVLYSHISRLSPSLVADDARAQEEECYAKAGKNQVVYKNAVSNAMTSLKKREVPMHLNHPSIGTLSTYTATHDRLSQALKPITDISPLVPFVHAPDMLAQWGYLTTKPTSTGGNGDFNYSGRNKVCNRCHTEFVVGDTNTGGRAQCTYHWGRVRMGKQIGVKTKLFQCCQLPQDSTGCSVAQYHVFKETDAEELHKVHGFITTAELDGLAENDIKKLEVAGLDCEMIYSTAGMSCARITLVDSVGAAVFDELVKMSGPVKVLDYNTRFSGVKTLDKAVMDLNSARKALGQFITSDTILIGHGLENDLQTLRLIHTRVIDTAILFPHPLGLPYRYALRDLAKTHSRRVIQGTDLLLEGHSSLEDANAAFELVRNFCKV